MSEMQPLSPIESIEVTLQTYDPESRGILIGTSALHWVLYDRGCTTDDLPLRDVDLLVPELDIPLIREEIPEDLIEGFEASSQYRLKVIPSDTARRVGVLALDFVSDSDSYDDPLVKTKFNGRVYARDANLDSFIVETRGIRHLSLPFVFWWKSAVGRDSDISTIQASLRLMMEGSFYANEFMEARNAISLGLAGYDMYGNFVFSSDPHERSEQEVSIALVNPDY